MGCRVAREISKPPVCGGGPGWQGAARREVEYFYFCGWCCSCGRYAAHVPFESAHAIEPRSGCWICVGWKTSGGRTDELATAWKGRSGCEKLMAENDAGRPSDLDLRQCPVRMLADALIMKSTNQSRPADAPVPKSATDEMMRVLEDHADALREIIRKLRGRLH